MVQIKVSVALFLTAAAAAITPVVAPDPPYPVDYRAEVSPSDSGNSNVALLRTPGPADHPKITNIYLKPGLGSVEHVGDIRNRYKEHLYVPYNPGSRNIIGITSPHETTHDIHIHHVGSEGKVIENKWLNSGKTHQITLQGHDNRETKFLIYHNSAREEMLTHIQLHNYPPRPWHG